MIKFDILNRFSGKVQFTAEIDCSEDAPRSLKVGLAAKWGKANKANLGEANLWGANLGEANLRGADLGGANLGGADLRGANLGEANLGEANLRGADLGGANLGEANLWGANLGEANLWGADLREANLRGANLRGANLGEANLGEANLRGADLWGARNIADRIIDGGLRSDGYRFLLTRTDEGVWRIKAGCRNFTVTDAKKHWDNTRPKGEELGDETRLLIKHMLAVAKLRKWEKSA